MCSRPSYLSPLAIADNKTSTDTSLTLVDDGCKDWNIVGIMEFQMDNLSFKLCQSPGLLEDKYKYNYYVVVVSTHLDI